MQKMCLSFKWLQLVRDSLKKSQAPIVLIDLVVGTALTAKHSHVSTFMILKSFCRIVILVHCWPLVAIDLGSIFVLFVCELQHNCIF